ncbi:hypothetical protein CDV36_006905 [Fusarium kuroshium]|uniref:Uncharacterized protein n=1 Tax=Fusarium kuroshium TaxID=2010991 RepID=A0A3M2S8J6_9HYPO|nr:hypothetical protein CDV36_006905 [Fusarium kuroshium]
MDPSGSNAEPEEFDYSLLDFDPDSLLDAWVEDLVVAGDHSAQHDRPVATPPDNIFSNMDTSFGGDDLAFDFGPLDHIQISDMPQDRVSGLDPSMTDLQGIDPFFMLDPSVLQHPDFMDFQFSTGSGQNPPSDVTMEDLTSSSCTNLGDLQEEAANVGNSIVFPLQTSMPIEGSDFMPQPHDSRAAHHIEHFEHQSLNAPGTSRHAPPTSFTPLGILPQVLGPDILTRRQLPPKRRGGRRVVIKKEIALFKNVDIQSMMILMGPLKTMLQQEAGQYAVIQSTQPRNTCRIPWVIVVSVLVSIFGDLHEDPSNWTMPSFSKVASTLADYAKKYFSRCCIIKFSTTTEDPHTPLWVRSIIEFCDSPSYQQSPESTIDDALPQFPTEDAGRLTSILVSWAGWVASRYLELHLFHHLQVIANNASFDSVEDRKSYIMTIFSVLLFSASYTQSIHEDAMDKKDPTIIPLYREVFDRRSRVQSALWVYCSIAVRGLPAWTNIWETVQLGWPFIQVETMAQQFHKSATAFNNNLSDTWESIIDSRVRFHDYYRLQFLLQKGVDYKTEGKLDFTECTSPEFRKCLELNTLDDWLNEYDQRSTGGLLSAQTTMQKRRASTRAFATLAMIDWRRKPVLPWDCTKSIAGEWDLLQSFAERVFRRLANMQVYTKYAQQCPAGTTPEEFLLSFVASQGSTPTPQTSGDRMKNLIRSARRWNELQDIVGLEVILIHDTVRDPRCDLQTFYIPSIVENGSDRQFTHLKEIIPTRLQWLAEACVELRGLVHMLKTASTTEGENATVIQDQIQTMITAAFGSRSSVEEALLSGWYQQRISKERVTALLRPEAATFPLDIKWGMFLCLLGRLDTRIGEEPDICVDFEMKENVCHEAESLMERDCSTLDSDSRSELRVWSHKVIDFWRTCLPVDTASRASG